MNQFSRRDLQYLLAAIKFVRDHTTNMGDAMRELKRRIEDMLEGMKDE